jgi:hypothetical protein
MTTSNLRVFVSSTYEDLKQYRQTVRDTLLRVGAMPVMIEDFSAIDEQVSDKAKQELYRADAIVMIVGYRYGTLVSHSNRSFIEMEYDAAKDLNKPIIVFMASEDAPWPAKFIDPDRTKINEFRQRIASEFIVHMFNGPDDLRSDVLQAFTQLISTYFREPKTDAKSLSAKQEIRIARLLLSSPGDVAEERERVAKAVFRFNQYAVEELGLFIKLIRWEDMAPQIGPKAQPVINKQIGEYHLFCGIMWNRFGTPTEIAASGTKEEFDAAVACFSEKSRPWITFYFCNRPSNFTTPEQLEQKRQVIEFQNELSNKGVVRGYLSVPEFEDMVYEDLRRITKLPEFLRILDSSI